MITFFEKMGATVANFQVIGNDPSLIIKLDTTVKMVIKKMWSRFKHTCGSLIQARWFGIRYVICIWQCHVEGTWEKIWTVQSSCLRVTALEIIRQKVSSEFLGDFSEVIIQLNYSMIWCWDLTFELFSWHQAWSSEVINRIFASDHVCNKVSLLFTFIPDSLLFYTFL